MNIFYLKYLIVIAAVLGTTAVVSTPLTPYGLTGEPQYEGEISAESVIQFGSETFYAELEKPGNEYLREGVSGYSQDLLPTEEQEKEFNAAWSAGILSFHTGYSGCTDAFYRLLTVPGMDDRREKNAVCDGFRTAKEDLREAMTAFTAAKASISPASSQGFTIGMVLPRVSAIESQAEDAEISCMKAVLADRDDDRAGFEENIRAIEENIRGMRRLLPELMVLSDDFGDGGEE